MPKQLPDNPEGNSEHKPEITPKGLELDRPIGWGELLNRALNDNSGNYVPGLP